MRRWLGLTGACVIACCAGAASGAQELTLEQARDALHRAVVFARNDLSSSGGYVYRWSADLTKREGENRVGPTTAWLEPPGTPSWGMAYLEAHRLTRDPALLEASVEAGMALVRGQLESGGWDDRIEYAPRDRRRYAYRVDRRSGERLRNTTTFDDDKSQSALRFLMQLDVELGGEHEAIHEAVAYAQEAFLAAQYPNGAWPQRYQAPADARDHPVKRASYPESWSRTFPDRNYTGYYTLNDDTISDLIVTMLEAHELYADERFLAAARQGGEFFLLAQMPEPQPGWAQQYDRDMHPAWARKFEPPAITGGESQGVLRTLMLLARRTGDLTYLEPIPRALEYYRQCVRPGGRIPRFLELRTNRPLFFNTSYELTEREDDLPTHYAFLVTSHFDEIEREYQEVVESEPGTSASAQDEPAPVWTAFLEQRARASVEALDERGAWVEPGRMEEYGEEDDTREVIQSRTCFRHIRALAEFLAASKE